jgi:hypothetical protein
MTKLEEKLIKDTDANRKAKVNIVTAIVGGILMLAALACFIIKAMSVEYVDSHGILHENFFLVPVGYLFLFAGLVVILASVVSYFVHKKRYNRS